jgi:predicted phosphate transport protein (TIGR00153 family)
MKLDKIFQFLVPKDKKFFPLFCDASANLVNCTTEFQKLLNFSHEEERTELVKRVKKLEKIGDKITMSIIDELNSTFITPFDREDIQKLANRIDNVVDLVNTSAKRIQLYKLNEIPPVFHQMAELLIEASREIDIVVRGLKNIHSIIDFKDHIVRISELENESDVLNYSYLSEIFDTETNAISLIKKRDILISLEKAMDRCEDVADILNTIQVKYA